MATIPSTKRSSANKHPDKSERLKFKHLWTQLKSATQWKTVLAIAVLALATYKGWNEAWGMLFLFWVFLSIRNKEAFLVEKVAWSTNPVLFVVITGFWFLFGVMNLIWQGDSVTALGSYLYQFMGWW